MQKVVHRLRLDLERPGIQAVSYMRKGDTLSRRMVLSLYEQGKPYRIEDGVTARIRGKKSDGTILYNDCFVQDNCIVVDVTTQMLAALGEVECELNLYGTSNALLTTPRFSIVVEDVLLADGQLESQNEFTAMTKATEEMKTLYNTVDEAYKSGAFKGDKGDKGDDGAPGKDGADGKDGAQGKDGSPGVDGISPTLSISDIPGGHRVTITDAIGEKSFDVLNGDAESDKLWKPTVSADGMISWTKTTEENAPTPQNIKGPQGSPGTPGADGKPGADGVSPSIAVTQITGGHHVSVTDAAGTKGFDVLDGAKGADGAPGIPGSPGAAGTPGADGTTFTPSVDVNGDLSWTNDGGKPNPDTVNIKGPQGSPGTPGADGKPGADGVSPSIAVTQITGGHHVSVTDAAGTKGFDVLDGAKGADGAPGIPGSPGAAGTPGADGTTFTPSVDVNGDLSWTNDGGKPNPDTVNIKGPKGDKGEKGDGSDITVDANLDINSTNPVQNKAVTLAISGKADAAHIHTADQIIEGVFPIDRGGTDASTAAGARANLNVPLRPKLLWSGSWTSGSITVGDFSSYKLLLVQTTDGDSAVCWKDGNLLLGGSLYPLSGTSGQMAYSVRASFSGNRLTLQNSYALVHSISGQHSGQYGRTVSAIYGLLLNDDVL